MSYCYPSLLSPNKRETDNCTVLRFIILCKVNLVERYNRCCLVWHRCVTAVFWFPLPCPAPKQLCPAGETLGGILKWHEATLGFLGLHKPPYVLLNIYFYYVVTLWSLSIRVVCILYGDVFCPLLVPWIHSRAGMEDLLVGVGHRPQ